MCSRFVRELTSTLYSTYRDIVWLTYLVLQVHPTTPTITAPLIPARRNPGPPVISPRPAHYKLPPPPRPSCNAGEHPVDRQSIRGYVDDFSPKDTVEVTAAKNPVQQQTQSQPQPQPQPQQQPQHQPQHQLQQQPQQQQQPQLRTRRFKVPPPIKCISEQLDGGSRESYEMMTPAATMSPNRQVSN